MNYEQGDWKISRREGDIFFDRHIQDPLTGITRIVERSIDDTLVEYIIDRTPDSQLDREIERVYDITEDPHQLVSELISIEGHEGNFLTRLSYDYDIQEDFEEPSEEASNSDDVAYKLTSDKLGDNLSLSFFFSEDMLFAIDIKRRLDNMEEPEGILAQIDINRDQEGNLTISSEVTHNLPMHLTLLPNNKLFLTVNETEFSKTHNFFIDPYISLLPLCKLASSEDFQWPEAQQMITNKIKVIS